MQKARSQPSRGSPPTQPPTACRHVVSGPLSLPAKGCFSPVPHGTRPLSVTRESFSLGGWSPQLRARFLGSGATQEHRWPCLVAFAYRALTVCGPPFQGSSTGFDTTVRGSYNPSRTSRLVWARPLSLAATRGISVDFSSLTVLRCFSSRGSPHAEA